MCIRDRSISPCKLSSRKGGRRSNSKSTPLSLPNSSMKVSSAPNSSVVALRVRVARLVEINEDRKKVEELDGEICKVFYELETESQQNIELAQKIGKQYVLGSFKEFLEARVKSLELHIKNLRAKRK
eukprot:TRINITY_DN3521_c0_g2_i6.p2 TRINITY_DN3521_c0_g2~~TRINITY_DN3521_c0_g2_i6.p2  ORF type:complete len:142 (-),score=25.84 TRINITY_DN3521_c0_g2_i6:429-809(-)